MSGELVLFGAMGALMLLCALMVVIARHPVTSAMFLVGQLFLLSGFYAMLGAHFIAAIQIIVYAGAIMVLFIFVIMLLNLHPDSLKGPNLPASEVGMLVVTILGFGVIAAELARGHAAGVQGAFSGSAIEAAGGNTFVVGMQLLTTYLWPFELSSILILLAIVASVMIAKKHGESEK